MLDAFQREDKVIYPSWTENKRLVWRRLLNNMPLRSELVRDGWRIRRGVAGRFTVMQEGAICLDTHEQAQHQRVNQAIQLVLNCVLEGEEEMGNELKLSERALHCLAFLSSGPKQLKDLHYHPSIFTALEDRGLIRGRPDGGFEITGDGQRVVQGEVAQIVRERLETSGPPPSMRKEKKNGDSEMEIAVSAKKENSCTENCADCLSKRVLDLLMNISPEARAIYEHMAAVDELSAKLKGNGHVE